MVSEVKAKKYASRYFEEDKRQTEKLKWQRHGQEHRV